MKLREKQLYLLEAAFNIAVTHFPSHLVRQVWLRWCGVQIGQMVSIFRGCTFQGSAGVSIGDGSTIGWRCHLDGRGTLTIGAQVAIASDVHLITAEHDPQARDFAERRESVEVGDRAWIATRAMVLPGVRIGHGSVVAGGAVATRSVPDYVIVGGIPARPIGTRTQDLAYASTFRPWFY